jgi:hypothetical protein
MVSATVAALYESAAESLAQPVRAEPLRWLRVAQCVQILGFVVAVLGFVAWTHAVTAHTFLTDRPRTSRDVALEHTFSFLSGHCNCTNYQSAYAATPCDGTKQIHSYIRPGHMWYSRFHVLAVAVAFAEIVLFRTTREIGLQRMALRALQPVLLGLAAFCQFRLLAAAYKFYNGSCGGPTNLSFRELGFIPGFATFARIGMFAIDVMLFLVILWRLIHRRTIADTTIMCGIVLLFSGVCTSELHSWLEHHTGHVEQLGGFFGRNVGLHAACSCVPATCTAWQLDIIPLAMVAGAGFAGIGLVLCAIDASQHQFGIVKRTGPIAGTVAACMQAASILLFVKFAFSFERSSSEQARLCPDLAYYVNHLKWGYSFYFTGLPAVFFTVGGYLVLYVGVCISREPVAMLSRPGVCEVPEKTSAELPPHSNSFPTTSPSGQYY